MRTPVPVLLLVTAACAAPPASQAGDPVSAPRTLEAPRAGAGALARFSAEKLLVLPLQGLASFDPLGWRSQLGTELVVIPRVDSLLEAELTGRRLAGKWAFASALRRAVKRNPTYLTDPYAIRATPHIIAHLRKPDDPLTEPFASQVRALAGVTDVRYALVPLDIRFDSTGSGGIAAMRLALVDVRTSRVIWWGEVHGAPQPAYGPAVIDDLIQRVADLVIPR